MHGQTGEGTVEFGGSKPFSEPESRIVRLVAENTQPQAYVNLHSGEWAMYVPWDSQKETAPGLPVSSCLPPKAAQPNRMASKVSGLHPMLAAQHSLHLGRQNLASRRLS